MSYKGWVKREWVGDYQNPEYPGWAIRREGDDWSRWYKGSCRGYSGRLGESIDLIQRSGPPAVAVISHQEEDGG